MNTVQSLTFQWSLWTLAISFVMIVATVAVSGIAWRRSGYRRDHGLLELLRLAMVALIIVLLNQPEWVEEYRPDEKPSIAVLWDASASMDTRDVPASTLASGTDTTPPNVASPPNVAPPMVSRREAVLKLTESPFWASLQDRLSVIIQPFSAPNPEEPNAGQGSNLHQPLATAPERFRNLRGVVLASDGDWNTGEPPVLAASALRLKGSPVFTVPVGSTSRLPDVELISLDAPTFGISGKAVRIPFAIDSTLPREYTATVKLTTSEGDELTKDVPIAAMGRTSDWLLWKPKASGEHTLTLEIPRHDEELLADNNRLSTPIVIREERLRVLVVESVPRWEYRYLRNALSRDPGVEVSCLLFLPGLSKGGGGNQDYIKQFPAGLDELSRYDVVFLGDVGVEEGQLTEENCRLLKGLVEHQASGLVFMPGWHGRQFSMLDTELGDLCPVVMDPAQPGGWGARLATHFELTELGRRSLLTRLADTQDDNIEVWENLPGFQWYAPVIRAKAGSEVLCVHKDVSNEFGRLPLLATRTFGSGKVLFMGTDGAWRWRKGVEDKYHYRFWGQVVRWMAYQRNMARGESMRMYYSPEQPQVRQTIALSANVMEQNGEPLPRGHVTARITSPSGRPETVTFTSTGDEWGAFAGRFTAEEPGRHEFVLSCQQTGATLEGSIYVQGAAIERIGRAARPEVLEEIARVTNGQVISLDRLEQVLQSLAALPDPPPAVRRVQLWCHPAVAALLVTMLGLFWIGRKVVGLI